MRLVQVSYFHTSMVLPRKFSAVAYSMDGAFSK